MRNSIIAALWIVISLLAPRVYAEETPAALPFKGIGMLYRPVSGEAAMLHAAPAKELTFIPEGQSIPIYAAPDKTSAQVGELMNSPDGSSVYGFASMSSRKREDSGLIDKIIGSDKQAIKLVVPATEVRLPTGIVGLMVMNQKGVWYLTDHGWIEKTPAWRETSYVDWKNVYKSENMLEDFFLPESIEPASSSTIQEMRARATHVPSGSVPIYSDQNASKPTTTISKPLQYTLLEKQDEWLKVFVTYSDCKASSKSDFREGTIGWVKLFNDEGFPQILKKQSGC